MSSPVDTSAQGRTEHRTLTVSLRPSRYAVGYPATEQWMTRARRAIGGLSRFWGGAQAVLLPIGAAGGCDPILLNVLRNYDPDYVGRHVRTLTDFAAEQPERFDAVARRYAAEGEKLAEVKQRLLDADGHRPAEDGCDWGD